MHVTWRTLFCLFLSITAYAETDKFQHYQAGDTISSETFVHDKAGGQIRIKDLVSDNKLSILYLFGGGAMGLENKTGGLWCTDSYEDSHILRTLYAKYKGQDIGFIPVAFPAVFHTHYMNHPKKVFLNANNGSEEFVAATNAFVESTWSAHEQGIIPMEPYFDLRFRLLRARDDRFGPVENSWEGAFRKPGETQTYGVPSFWLVDKTGKILAAPFRGNIYHGLPETYSIAYTLKEVDQQIQSLLSTM